MDLIGQLAAVGAVLSLLVVALWWLRRRGFAPVLPRRAAQGRLLEPLERVPLGPQHTLHLVRLGEQAVLIACSPAGCCVVATRGWSELAGEARS